MADKSSKQNKKEEDLKKQIAELISSDHGLLERITEAVSSCIVDNILSNPDFIQNVATKVSGTDSFTKSIVNDLGPSVKQEIYESLTYDQHELKEKNCKLEETCEKVLSHYDELQSEFDNLEQYGRRNCLLIHGIPEVESSNIRNENTDAQVINITNEKLGLHLEQTDLDRTHRLGRRNSSNTSSRPRPVIVKFTSYNVRSEVFKVKKKLKGSGIGITESLTVRRQTLYNTVRNHRNVENVWTLDGRIIAIRSDDNRKVILEKKNDLSKLT